MAPPDEGGDGEVNLFAAFLRSTSKLELPEIGEGGGGGVGGAAGRWGMVRQSVGMGSGSVGREGSSEVKGVEAPAQLRSMVREAGSTEKVGVEACHPHARDTLHVRVVAAASRFCAGHCHTRYRQYPANMATIREGLPAWSRPETSCPPPGVWLFSASGPTQSANTSCF